MIKSIIRKDNKGFTLVELIVVIVILAILAAILVPALLGYIDRSKAANCVINKSSFVKAATSLYVEDYASKKSIQDDESFDDYLKTRISSLYENANPTGETLKYSNVCKQGGIVTLRVQSYTDRPLVITAICSLHDEGISDSGHSGNIPTKTPEQVQKETLTNMWSSGLSHNTGEKSSNGYTLGKAIVSNKPEDIRELVKKCGVDTDNNIVALKNTLDLATALSNELGKNVDKSYTKVLSISADNKGPNESIKKGDERVVTQFLFYKGKDSNNKDTQVLYGTRIVKLTYTEDGNLGKYTVKDLDGNTIDDTNGLVGWEKNE